jgi:hypothetical protein
MPELQRADNAQKLLGIINPVRRRVRQIGMPSVQYIRIMHGLFHGEE